MTQKNEMHNGPRVYQFKNSFHFGFTNCNELYELKQSKKYQLGLSRSIYKHPQVNPLSLTKSRSLSDNSRQLIQKIGLTIDDEGNVMIGQWANGKIEGSYFLYKPNTFQYSEHKNHHPGICQYGNMSNGVLDGENYLYDISGQIAKSIFLRDKIGEKCHIFSKSKFINTSTQSIECQIISFPVSSTVNQSFNLSSKPTIVPPLKQISDQQKKRISIETESIPKDSIIGPTILFDSFVKKYKEYCENGEDKYVLRKIILNEQKIFIGFVRNVEDLQQQSIKELSQSLRLHKINGWGIMFKNEWPEKYGVFECGKLAGFGRKYVSELIVHDGLFKDDQLIDGFIFDYFNKKTYLGIEDRDGRGFKIMQAIDEITQARMLQFKKRLHLKAIGYSNNYFNLPSLIYRSPWPLLVTEIMTKNNVMLKVLKEFRPDCDFSEIQRKQNTTEHRVERQIIKQMGEQSIFPDRDRQKMKTLTIKNLLGTYLIQNQQGDELKKVIDQCELQNNIDLYIKILEQQNTSKNRIGSTIDSQRQNLEKPKKLNNCSVYFNEIKQINQKEQKQRQQKTEKKRQVIQLDDLIHEYNECETARGSLVKSKTIFQDSTTKKKEIVSKRSMIKQDHERLNQKKTKGGACHCHSKKLKPTLDLVKMYKQFLRI